MDINSCMLTPLTEPQLQAIADIIGSDPFMEVACGDGWYVEKLQEMTGAVAYGIDCSTDCFLNPESKVHLKYAFFDDWVIARKETWASCKTVLMIYPDVYSTVSLDVAQSILEHQTFVMIAPRPYRCKRWAATREAWTHIVNNFECLDIANINGVDFMYVLRPGDSKDTALKILQGNEVFDHRIDDIMYQRLKKLQKGTLAGRMSERLLNAVESRGE